MKASECFSISQACWNFVICFIILNSIYFNIYHFSAKGEEQGRNTENTDICSYSHLSLCSPEHYSPVHGRRGRLSTLLLCRRAVNSYCAGGPWRSCLVLVQRSHLKLVGFKVSFPVFFLLLFSLVYSAMGFLSFLSRSGGYFVVSPTTCMHACTYLYVYQCMSFLSTMPGTLSESDLWGHAQPSHQGGFVASLRYTLVPRKTREFDAVHDLTQWLLPRASM